MPSLGVPSMGVGRWVLVGAGVTAAVLTLRAGIRIIRVLSIHEAPYHWLSSVIPPDSYKVKDDVAGTKEYIEKHHAGLLPHVESGTLNVLLRPEDYDRSFPEALYVLGTAHVSRRTAEAVYDTIYEVEPDAVVVELCKSRAVIMYRDPPAHLMTPAPSAAAATAAAAAAAAAAASGGAPALEAKLSQDPAPGTSPADSPTVSNSASDASSVPKKLSAKDTKPRHGSSSSSRGGSSSHARKKGRSKEAQEVEGVQFSTLGLMEALMQAVQRGDNVFQVLLGWAYSKFEAELKTPLGLEFVRARHAIEDLESKPGRQYPPLRSTTDGGPMVSTPIMGHTPEDLSLVLTPQLPGSSSHREAGGAAGSADGIQGGPASATGSEDWSHLSSSSSGSIEAHSAVSIPCSAQSPASAVSEGRSAAGAARPGSTPPQSYAAVVAQGEAAAGDSRERSEENEQQATSTLEGAVKPQAESPSTPANTQQQQQQQQQRQQSLQQGQQEKQQVLPRVHVYFGDVPLNKTVRRAWGVLSVWQKLRLVWTLLHDILLGSVDEDMIEELLQADMLELFQKEFGRDYPQILGPLLHERNWQLAHTIHLAAQHGMRRIVLVIGRGHVPGVIYSLLHPYRMRKAHQAYLVSQQQQQQQQQQRLPPTS